MTVCVPTPPDQIFASLIANLPRVARSDASLIPEERVEVSRPLPIYVVESGRDLATAYFAGWRFILLASQSAFWVDLENTEIVEILEGPAVDSLLKAAARAEAAAADGEARILIQPLVGGGAIWIHGQDERLWTYAPSASEDEIGQSDLFSNWEEQRSLMMAGSTNALE
jgi:hypothetical protein